MGKLLLLGLLCCSLATQGCIAAAVGHAIHKSRSEAADKEAEARLQDSYNRYKADAEKANAERRKMGLKSEPVKSYAEWKQAHNIPAPETKAAPSEAKK